MKICMLFEGSYPHITGGVSTWAQMLVKNISRHEFMLYTIGADSKFIGKFKYDLPPNVLSVRNYFSIRSLREKEFMAGDTNCLLISEKALRSL